MTEKQQPPMSKEEIQEFKNQIKAQLVQEMKDEKTLAMEEASIRREEEDKERQRYFDKMKESPEPWVEIISWIETEKGVKVNMEWNNAFIDHLKAEGVPGTDDDQIVQKWVALLLYNVADDMGDNTAPEAESEFT